MAIEKIKSSVFGGVNTPEATRIIPDKHRRAGVMQAAAGTVSNDAAASDGSEYTLCEIPSHAILRPESVIDLQGWGFVEADVGADGYETGLLDIADTTLLTAPSKPIADIESAKWGKELWEQLGMPADPRGKIAIKIFVNAAAAGAGVCNFDIVWQAD